jgi:hypothetical protein
MLLAKERQIDARLAEARKVRDETTDALNEEFPGWNQP